MTAKEELHWKRLREQAKQILERNNPTAAKNPHAVEQLAKDLDKQERKKG